MSSVNHAVDQVSAKDELDKTPPSNSPQELQNDTAGEGTSETPTPNSHEDLEKHIAADNATFKSDVNQYPAPLALFFLMLAICVSIFLVSLDRTIITTVRERAMFP